MKVDAKEVDRQLRMYAAKRASVDVGEAPWLVACDVNRCYVELGYPTILAYMERVLGYAPMTAKERLRVAHALLELPVTTRALEDTTLCYSAVREISRVVTPETEQAWVAAADGMNVREVEALVAGHRKGDLPGDPKRPELRRHVLRYEASPETVALEREARKALELELGTRLTNDELLAIAFRTVLEGASQRDPGRASHQIALSVCPECRQAKQTGAGVEVAVSRNTVERAECDAQHLGRVDGGPAERSKQDVPPRIRRQVWARDHGRCAVPHCRSARYLELHHIVHQKDGGSHDPSNLMLMCGAHHRRHHDGLFDVTGTAPHHLEFELFAEHVPRGIRQAA